MWLKGLINQDSQTGHKLIHQQGPENSYTYLVLLVAILWGFTTPCFVTVESTWVLPQPKATQEAGKLLGDGPLYLLQKATSHVGALLREEFEIGNGVDAKEVLVGLSVGKVKLANIGLCQDGLEDVEFIRIFHNVLKDQFSITKEGHFVLVSLQIAVNQEGMNADPNGMLADESNLVLQPVFDHLVQVFQKGDLFFEEQFPVGVRLIVLWPEGADINPWRLRDIDERGQAPEEGPIHSHEHLCGQVVSLVQDDPYLGLASLQLAKEHFQLQTHIQLGGVKDNKDEVGSVDEPLAHVVEGVALRRQREKSSW